MSSQTERVKALLYDLQQDMAHYQQLSELLCQQREALIACHVSKCTEIGDRLMSVYPQLTASAQRRAQTLLGFMLPADGSGIHALFSRLPATIAEQAQRCWMALEQQARHCQQMNQRNGLLLENQREMLHTLLPGQPEDFLYAR